MKNIKPLLTIFLISISTVFAQTVKRSKVVSNGGVHGMAYHPNVGMVVLHSGTHLGFPALNAQEVDKETGNPISVDFPFLDGFLDATSDDNGGWFIVKGNEFTKIDESIFSQDKWSHILHIKSDYSIDTTFKVQNIYANGDYNFRGILRILKYQNLLLAWCSLNDNVRLLAFDATTGSLVWDSKTEAKIHNLNMQISQNKLFISGNFTKIVDLYTATTKAICFDLTSKKLTNWNPTTTLNINGYTPSDMAISGEKIVFCSADFTNIIAVDSVTGSNKLWEYTAIDFGPQKIVADSASIYCLSLNRHVDINVEEYSKLIKINAQNGLIDNGWTIATNYTKKLYNLYLDQNHLYATADDDITVLGTRTSTLLKINKTNRTVENWKPFNDAIINGVSPESGLGVYGNELKLKFINSKVLIGGNYNLLKHNKKDGIAIIRPESENIVSWYPNVKSCYPRVATFENDSTLWVWGNFTTNENQHFINHFAAFDVKTGNLLKNYPTNLPTQNIIKKMEVSNGKIIATYDYASAYSPSSGSNGYLQSYNSNTGSLENWITCGIVNNFFVRDSLLYTNVGICVNNEQRFSFSSVNLKTNQFTNWVPQYPPDYSGNYEDFVIVGNAIVVMTPTKYYEFDRFTGELKNSFGQLGDGGKFITAGEKYFFIARNGYNYYQPNRCGNNTVAFYYDLEYKKFSETCFLSKPFPLIQGNTQLPSAFIDRQFFLAQNYLYFNVSWSGYNVPVSGQLGNFLRTSFPKGFFKDEINPAFFPKIGGNTGFVTINFYGYSFVEGCKIRFKKVGEDDIVVADSMVFYPERFRLEAKVNFKGRALGAWDVEVELPNGEKSVFFQGFNIININTNLHLITEIITPRALRPGATTKINFLVTNNSNVDGFGIPVYIYLSKNISVTSKPYIIQNGVIILSDSVTSIAIDSIASTSFIGNCYMYFIPQILSKESFLIELKIKTSINGSSQYKLGILTGKSILEIDNLSNSNAPIGLISNYEGIVTFKTCMRSTLECLLDVALSEKCLGIISWIARLGQQVYFSVAKNEPVYKGAIDIGFTYTDLIKCGGGIVSKKLRQLHDILTLSTTSIECISGIYGDCNANKNSEKFIDLPLIASYDPNDKLGPVGVKEQRYVNRTDPLSYKIRFENFANATAAAQYVKILDTLDRTKFNFDTFQFGYFNVADTNFYASPGKKRHLVDWDLRPEKDLILRMEAKFIDSTGILEATYTALDPATMEWTEDPILGFLPPNVNAPEGEGSLTFSIFPKDSLATGTSISNKAYIYFDYNPVIPTPPWVNTIDATLPSSSMSTLPLISRDTTLHLSWNGSDAESGPKLYDVMVSVNEGDYKPLLIATKFTEFDFKGKLDSTYSFYTIGYDSVYNKELLKINYDTKTTIKNFTLIQSIKSGNWNEPGTWDCNCLPIKSDKVIIKTGHRIEVSLGQKAECKSILIEQGAIFDGKPNFVVNPNSN